MRANVHGLRLNTMLVGKEFTMIFQLSKYKSSALIAFLALNNFAFGSEIMNAAASGNLEKAKVLLKANPDDVNTTNNFGDTPLHWAAASNRPDVTKLLIANKADVNKRNIFGRTPLGLASSKGYKDMVELLLTNNADVNGNGNNVTPLIEAQRLDHEDVEEVLLQHGGYGSKCTTKPFVGWYSDGDIRFHLLKIVTDDYQEYITKNKLVMPSEFDIFYENQTGKCAVTFEAFPPGQNATWRHAIIYDKDNKRIKVTKYDYHRYQS
jgi:ankyrin repeat protein